MHTALVQQVCPKLQLLSQPSLRLSRRRTCTIERIKLIARRRKRLEGDGGTKRGYHKSVAVRPTSLLQLFHHVRSSLFYYQNRTWTDIVKAFIYDIQRLGHAGCCSWGGCWTSRLRPQSEFYQICRLSLRIQHPGTKHRHSPPS